MEPDRLSRTSVRNYHYSLRKNPEGRSSQLLRGGNLNSLLSVLGQVHSLFQSEFSTDSYLMFPLSVSRAPLFLKNYKAKAVP